METELSKQLKGLSPKEILDQLEGLCEKVEESTIRREMTLEERAILQEELVAKSIKRQILEEKFEEIKRQYKEDDGPLKTRNHEIIQTLRTNVIEYEGKVYQVPSYELDVMGYYDENGKLINVRPLLPKERQRNLVADSMQKVS